MSLPSLHVGNDLNEGVQTGPFISAASQERIEGLIGKGLEGGVQAILERRKTEIPNGSRGAFLKATILTEVPADNPLIINRRVRSGLHSNPQTTWARPSNSCPAVHTEKPHLFSLRAGRRSFHYEAPTGNVRINIGEAVTMAYVPV